MKKFILIFLFLNSYLLGFSLQNNIQSDSLKNSSEQKLKFVILWFKISPEDQTEISDLNKLAKEFDKYVSSVTIKDDDLSKYKELFTKNEFKSLEDFIQNKKECVTVTQKNITSFPVILILDKNGKVKNAWSGDKSDGLKKEDFYIKIKRGLEAIAKEK